jgi:protein gp37
MKLTNAIGWCDDTGNMVIGCTKVSPGCAHCYAANDTPARVLRAGRWTGYPQPTETWGPAGVRVPVKALATKARRLNNLCICDTCRETRPVGHLTSIIYGGVCPNCSGNLRRIRLFADSNSDWLDDRWPVDTLAELLGLIHECRNIDWQLLTKRPENWRKRVSLVTGWRCADAWKEAESDVREMARAWVENGKAPAHVHLGVSVEDQKRADERIPELLKIPAAVRWLSLEPLLGEVDVGRVVVGEERVDYDPLRGKELPGPYCRAKIDWLVIGGESGQPGAPARPCNVEWVRALVRQGRDAGVPCYVKQLGSTVIEGRCMCPGTLDGGPGCKVCGARRFLCAPAGSDPIEWEVDLRVREFPKGPA